jgi:hypothetical protein
MQRRRTDPRRTDPTIATMLAWLAVASPCAAWLSQCVFASGVAVQVPALFLIVLMLAQLVLVVGGLALGIVALFMPGGRRLSVMLPAILGMGLSTFTIFINVVLITVRLLR